MLFFFPLLAQGVGGGEFSFTESLLPSVPTTPSANWTSITPKEQVNETNVTAGLPAFSPIIDVSLRAPLSPRPWRPPVLSAGRSSSGVFGESTMEIPVLGRTSFDLRGSVGMTVKFGATAYTDPSRSGMIPPSGITPGFGGIEPQMQIGMKAVFRDRLGVTLDYNAMQQEYMQVPFNFLLFYQGAPGEILRYAEAGKISLSLPATRLISYSKSAMGIKGRLELLGIESTFIFSKPLSRQVIKKFQGIANKNTKDIKDVDYQKLKFFYVNPVFINATQAYLIKRFDLFIDDRDASNDDTEPPDVPRTPGVDYILHSNLGIVEVKKSIQNNYVLKVAVLITDISGNEIFRYGYDENGGIDNSTLYVIKSEDRYCFYRNPSEDSLPSASRCLCSRRFYSIGTTNILPPKDQSDTQTFLLYLRRTDDPNSIIPSEDVREKYPYSVDYERGLIIFENEPPFSESEIYDPTYPRSVYTIHVEYRTPVVEYNLGFGIVEGSVEVEINGRKLKAGDDYEVDYFMGKLKFLKPELITEDAEIIVRYEFKPEFMTGGETVFGIHLKKRFSRLFSLHSLFVRSSTSSLQIPDITSTPTSYTAFDFGGILKLDEEAINLPINVNVEGEVAATGYDPNSYSSGRALLDNFEGFEEATYASMQDKGDKRWQLSSAPPVASGERGEILNVKLVEDGKIKDETIMPYATKPGPFTTEDYGHAESAYKKDLLNVWFRFTKSDQSWVGIQQLLSKAGVDLSKLRKIELWLKTDGWDSNDRVKIWIDIGQLSEDVDGDSVLDTEDINNNWILDKGEDTGFSMDTPEGVVHVGDDNGYLDSEDLDKDGYLDTESASLTFPQSDCKVYINGILQTGPEIVISGDMGDPDASGYTHVVVVMPDNATYSDLYIVKHVRLRIERFTEEGQFSVPDGKILKLLLESLSFSTYRWKEHYVDPGQFFSVQSVSTDSDSYYREHSLMETSFYNEAYPETTTTMSIEEKVERALKIVHALDSGKIGYVGRVFTSSFSAHGYKWLKVWIYLKDPPEKGDTLFIRLGSSTASYFQFEKGLYGLPLETWLTVDFLIEDKDRDGIPDGNVKVVGSPSLKNLLFLAVGVRGGGSGSVRELFVDDIYVEEIEPVLGSAARVSLGLSHRDLVNLSLSSTYTNANFSGSSGNVKTNDSSTTSINFYLTPPGKIKGKVRLNGAYSVSRNYYNPSSFTVVKESDKYNRENNSLSLGLSTRPLRDLNFNMNYSRSLAYTRYLNPVIDSQSGSSSLSQNFGGSFSYILTKFIGRNSFSGSFRLSDSKVDYSNENLTDRLSRSYSTSLSWEFRPSNIFNSRVNFSKNWGWTNTTDILPTSIATNLNMGAGLTLRYINISWNGRRSVSLSSFKKIEDIYPEYLEFSTVENPYLDALPSQASYSASSSLNLNPGFSYFLRKLGKPGQWFNRNFSPSFSLSFSREFKVSYTNAYTYLSIFPAYKVETLDESSNLYTVSNATMGDVLWDLFYPSLYDARLLMRASSLSETNSISPRLAFTLFTVRFNGSGRWSWRKNSYYGGEPTESFDRNLNGAFSINVLKFLPFLRKLFYSASARVSISQNFSRTKYSERWTWPQWSLSMPLNLNLGKRKRSLSLRSFNINARYSRSYSVYIYSYNLGDYVYEERKPGTITHNFNFSNTFGLAWNPKVNQIKITKQFAIKLRSAVSLSVDLPSITSVWYENSIGSLSYTQISSSIRGSVSFSSSISGTASFRYLYRIYADSPVMNFWGLEFTFGVRATL